MRVAFLAFSFRKANKHFQEQRCFSVIFPEPENVKENSNCASGLRGCMGNRLPAHPRGKSLRGLIIRHALVIKYVSVKPLSADFFIGPVFDDLLQRLVDLFHQFRMILVHSNSHLV